ncbi:hypothetical protein ACLOJK_014677 [Asimina triloba]
MAGSPCIDLPVRWGALGSRALVPSARLWGPSRPFCCRGGCHYSTCGLNEQSVLLDPPPLSFLNGNVVGNHFIELTNGVGRVKAELPRELMVPYALDEGRHIHLGEEAWDLPSFLIESGHVVSQCFVRPLVDANELGGGNKSLPLVGELFEAGYEAGGERSGPHFSLLIEGDREGSAFEPFKVGMKRVVPIRCPQCRRRVRLRGNLELMCVRGPISEVSAVVANGEGTLAKAVRGKDVGFHHLQQGMKFLPCHRALRLSPDGFGEWWRIGNVERSCGDRIMMGASLLTLRLRWVLSFCFPGGIRRAITVFFRSPLLLAVKASYSSGLNEIWA